MTFELVLQRIIRRWWVTVLLAGVFTLSFYNWSNQNSYLGSIGFGISPNSKELTKPQNPQQVYPVVINYSETLSQYSLYLSSRFSSIEVQSEVNRRADLGISSFDSVAPFYQVTNQGGGYVSLGFEAADQEAVERFLIASKAVFHDLIVSERFDNQLEIFTSTPAKDGFFESITEVSRPVQFKLLPTISGFVIGLAIATLWPEVNLKKSKGK